MPLRFTNRRQFIAAASGICGLGCSTLLAAPPPPLMAGQIGTRHSHASGKLEAMRSLTNDYNVVGVVEADTKSRESAQRQKSYAGLPWLEEQALLADAAVQVVVVETTLEASTETARRVIAAGKHLHLDKPGGADHAAFRTMRLEAEARGLVVLFCLSRNWTNANFELF